MEERSQLHGLASLPSVTHCTGSSVGPRAGTLWTRENLLPLPGIELHSPVIQPVSTSTELSWLLITYCGWDIKLIISCSLSVMGSHNFPRDIRVNVTLVARPSVARRAEALRRCERGLLASKTCSHCWTLHRCCSWNMLHWLSSQRCTKYNGNCITYNPVLYFCGFSCNLNCIVWRFNFNAKM